MVRSPALLLPPFVKHLHGSVSASVAPEHSRRSHDSSALSTSVAVVTETLLPAPRARVHAAVLPGLYL